MPTKCYLVQPTGIWTAYESASWGDCTANPWSEHHSARIVYATGAKGPVEDLFNHSEKRPKLFPAEVQCEYCGAAGTITYCNGGGMGESWIRPDTGEIHDRVHEFAVGAMYQADWLRMDNGLYGWDWDNLTEAPWHVILPGCHPWNIDSRASNCTLPNDKTHRCWVRHGTAPLFTVDKQGKTCAAGAGSILAPGYHGFLQGGYLT